MQSTNALAVQTSIFSKALSTQFKVRSHVNKICECPNLANKQGYPTLDKVPHGICVPVQISTGKSLVRAIEKGIMVLLKDHIGNHLPLLCRRVHPGGIVRATMQYEYGARRSGLEAVD